MIKIPRIGLKSYSNAMLTKFNTRKCGWTIYNLPLCIAYVPLAVVIDGSHFDDPTPTPNAPSGPIALTDITICAAKIIELNTNMEFIFDPHFFRIKNARTISSNISIQRNIDNKLILCHRSIPIYTENVSLTFNWKKSDTLTTKGKHIQQCECFFHVNIKDFVG